MATAAKSHFCRRFYFFLSPGPPVFVKNVEFISDVGCGVERQDFASFFCSFLFLCVRFLECVSRRIFVLSESLEYILPHLSRKFSAIRDEIIRRERCFSKKIIP